MLAVNTAGTSIAAAYNSANRTLALTGVASIQQYQQVLRTATYQNQSLTPSTTTRTVAFTVNDGTTNSNSAIATVQFSIVASAPIVDLDGAASANFSYAASFNRLSGAVNAVGPIATIVDTSSYTWHPARPRCRHDLTRQRKLWLRTRWGQPSRPLTTPALACSRYLVSIPSRIIRTFYVRSPTTTPPSPPRPVSVPFSLSSTMAVSIATHALRR